MDAETKEARRKWYDIRRRIQQDDKLFPKEGDKVVVDAPGLPWQIGVLEEIDWNLPYTDSIVEVAVPGGRVSTFYKHIRKVKW